MFMNIGGRMKFFKLLLVLLLAFTMLGVVGCEDDDDQTSTGLYLVDPFEEGGETINGLDWAVIGSMDNSFKDNDVSYIYVLPLYDSIWDEPYPFLQDISLTIGGEEITLEMFSDSEFYSIPLWVGAVTMTTGATFTYNLSVTEVNGTSHSYSANLASVYPTTTFNWPDTIVQGGAVEVSWTLPQNNQYQLANCTSYDFYYENDDEYEKELVNSIRSYTFPANCVDDFGVGTEYDYCIDQINQTTNGRFLVVSGYSNYMEYYKKGAPSHIERVERFKRILNLK